MRIRDRGIELGGRIERWSSIGVENVYKCAVAGEGGVGQSDVGLSLILIMTHAVRFIKIHNTLNVLPLHLRNNLMPNLRVSTKDIRARWIRSLNFRFFG